MPRYLNTTHGAQVDFAFNNIVHKWYTRCRKENRFKYFFRVFNLSALGLKVNSAELIKIAFSCESHYVRFQFERNEQFNYFKLCLVITNLLIPKVI